MGVLSEVVLETAYWFNKVNTLVHLNGHDEGDDERGVLEMIDELEDGIENENTHWEKMFRC